MKRPMKLSSIERFAQKFTPSGLSNCWNWEASLQDGYGYFKLDTSKPRRGEQCAHRVMWMFENGAIPEGLWVLHKCDNRRCVNPNHLFLGTHQDNVDDMMRKGRRAPTTGFNNPNSILTREQVLEIRKLREDGLFYKDIAKVIGCSYRQVEKICRRETQHDV